ncbi:MAG: phosphoglycerate dehydrogenase [Patescibacteria group bacterium]|jgi:D-3-phosphoglycerate dehydrogenase
MTRRIEGRAVLLLDNIGPEAVPILEQVGVRVIDAKRGFDKDAEAALCQYITVNFQTGELAAICLRSSTTLGAAIMPFLREMGVELIVRFGSGTDNIDETAASEVGIIVENTAGQNANGVAELVPAFMVALTRNVDKAIKAMLAREILPKLLAARAQLSDCPSAIDELVTQLQGYAKAEKTGFKGTEIEGKTVGIIGLGRIGSKVARKLLGMGMKVLAYDPKSELEITGVTRVELATLLAESDFITIHASGSQQLIGQEEIQQMAKRPYLFNLARRGVVDLAAVMAALQADQLAGFASDLDDPAHPVFGLAHTIITPHIGATTKESEARCAQVGAQHVVDWLTDGFICDGVNIPDTAIKRRQNGRLVVLNRNEPGALGAVTDCVRDRGLNIHSLANEGRERGGLAYTVMDLDDPFGEDLIAALAALPQVVRVIGLK